jgi:hypothetical protein
MRPLGRPRHRWEDIKTDRRRVKCEDVDVITFFLDMFDFWAFVTVVDGRPSGPNNTRTILTE